MIPKFLAGLLCVASAVAQTVIEKVEPPNWWTGHSVRSIRVLLTGSGLRAGVLQTDSPHVHAGPVKGSENGHYAFADLRIGAAAKPGKYTLRMNGAAASFELLPPVARQGRFQGFSADDVIYLIMVDRFANGDPSNDGVDTSYHGGDLKGIRQRLPYLKNLGVTTLWLTPVYENHRSYHGYHITDHYAVEDHFGDMNALRELVEAAHEIGLKIVLDQIANHIGPEHRWAADPPTPTWLNGSVENHLRADSPAWTLIDPYATPALQRSMLEGWFVNQLPDLNQHDPDVARYLTQNTLWWIAMTGIDGIRQDTVPYVPRAFWREWNAAIRHQYRRFSIVGEVYSSNPLVLSYFDRAGFPSLFDFPLHTAIRDVFARRTRPMSDLPAALSNDSTTANGGTRVTFLGSHDEVRFRTAAKDLVSLMDAFTFLLTTRGIPMIYYGDEIAMEGGRDPDNRRDFRDARTEEESAVLKHVRELLALRSKIRALRTGRLRNLAAGVDYYVYERASETERVVVALGNPPEEYKRGIEVFPLAAPAKRQ